MEKLKTMAMLMLILIFGLALRLFFFRGFEGSDDLGYYDFAHKVTQHKFDHKGHFHSTRIGVIYPTAFFYILFGINEITSNLLPLLTSLSSIMLIFSIGKFLFDEKTGLIAAFLLSFYPVNVIYSSVLYVDFPASFFIALGVFLFLRAEKKKSKIAHLFYLSSGISIGIAYLMKELSILIILFFLSYVIYKGRLRLEYLLKYLLAAAGFLLIFSFEMFYYASQSLSPFFRITNAESQSTSYVINHFQNYFGPKIWLRLFVHYPYVILSDIEARYFYMLFLVSIAYFIIKKKRETYTLMFWIIPVFLFLNFGSNSFRSYVPLPATMRYLDVLTIPCILLSAYFLNKKFFPNKKILVPCLIAFLLLISLYSMYFEERRFSIISVKEAKLFLESKSGITIYSDQKTSLILKYLFNFGRDESIFMFPGDLKEVHKAYVIVNDDMIAGLLALDKNIKFPPEISAPPKNWIVEKNIKVNEKHDIRIYYVP